MESLNSQGSPRWGNAWEKPSDGDEKPTTRRVVVVGPDYDAVTQAIANEWITEKQAADIRERLESLPEE